MKLFKKLICATAVALSTAGAANAGPVLNNWVFNPTGGGFANGQVINEYLDVNGNAFIQLNATGTDGSFSFRETAVYNIRQADSNGQSFSTRFPGGNITATFEAVGTGTLGGAFEFTGGTIRMYQNPTNRYASTDGYYGANLGEMIAEFNVLAGGGGMVNANGSPVNNGQVSVFASAQPGKLDPGYFFRGNGDDLSEESILSFAFTNANTIGRPNTRQVSEIICQFAGFTGTGCNGGTYRNRNNEYFFIGGNGQFKLAEVDAEVPEPGSLALFAVAMLGAGVAVRRRNNKA